MGDSMRAVALSLLGVMSVFTTGMSLMDLAWGGFNFGTAPSIAGLLAVPAFVLLFIRPAVGVGIFYCILVGEGLISGQLGVILWLLALALLAHAAFRLRTRPLSQ